MNIFKKSKVRYFLSILTVVSIFAGVTYFAFFRTEAIEAAWYDEDWSYRQIVEISNSGSAQTDFQSKIDMDTATLITAGKMQSDCDDIRVTDINGRILPHWIEADTGACNTSSTDIWVKVPSIETSGATILIYYGNSITNNVENGKEVFELFDDFNSVSGAWQTTSGDPDIVSGVAELHTTADFELEDAESFESESDADKTFGGDWVNAVGDDCDWQAETGATASGSTGPGSGGGTQNYNGNIFIYIEATAAAGNCEITADEAILDYDGLMPTHNTGRVTFGWNMYGAAMGSLFLEGWNGSSWATLWTETGDQGDVWNTESVDFNLTTYTDLRFRAVRGSDFTSDVAIDMIRVIDTTGEVPDVAETDLDATVGSETSSTILKGGPVWINQTTAYFIYKESGNSDIVYSKTTDGGTTWGTAVNITVDSIRKTAIWYDRWTPGNYGNLIHIIYINNTSDDVEYRSLDVTTDTLSTETVAYTGVSVTSASNGWFYSTVDIVKTRGGNLITCFAIDPDGENDCSRSVDDGANWTDRATMFDGIEADNILLMPGAEADSNDVIAAYEDLSAEDLTIKTYDDSANSWSESASLGTIQSENFNLAFGAAPRHSDNHTILVAWNDNNSGTADLDVYDITNGSTVTALTDAKVNRGTAQNAAVLVNQQNDDLYVVYRYGTSWQSSMNAYYLKSTDGGTTWDTEVRINVTTNEIREVFSGISVGFEGGWFLPVWYNATNDDLTYNKGLAVSIPAAEGVISKDTFTQGNYALRFRSKISATTGAGRGRLGFSNTSAFTNDFRADDAASIFVDLGSSDLNLETINDSTTQNSSDYTKDTSYHVNEIRWGSSSITLYEDGTLKATNSTQVPNEASNVRLEKGADGTLSVDWAFVRKYAATEPSVGAPSSEEKGPGPVAHWKFNEGYGTTANDSTINANNGTITNTTWQSDDLCLNEKCLYFDGAGDYITVENGITVTHLDDGHAGSGSSITSASISPQPNSLLLIYSVIRKGSDPGVPTITDTLTGTGVWTEAGGTRFDVTNGGDTRFALHYAQVGSSPGSGTVTVTWGVSSLSNSFTIEQVTGFDPDNPIVQQATAAYASGTTKTVTLSSFADSVNNAAVGFFNQSQVVSSATPGSGFTELSDIQAGSGSIHTQVSEYKVGEDTSVDVTWTAADGSTGYAVEIAAAVSFDLNMSGSSVTMSAWVNSSATYSTEKIIFEHDTWGSTGTYQIVTPNDSSVAIDFVGAASPNLIATFDIADGNWHHIVGVIDDTNNTTSLYIDGVLRKSQSETNSIGSSNAASYIGSRGGSSLFWDGKMDDVKVYNYARSADQIKTDYSARGGSIGAGAVLGVKDYSYLSNGLQGYWKMDELSWTVDCSTASVTDSSGAGNNGASCPNSTGPTGGATGKFGNGGDFDGDDDYVDVANTDGWSLPEGTISVWVKNDLAMSTDKNQAVARIMDAGGTSTNSIFLYSTWSDNMKLLILDSASTSWEVSDDSLNWGTGGWHHIVATWVLDNGRGNAEMAIYIDGVLSDNTPSNTGVITFDQTPDNLYLGNHSPNATNISLDGVWDEFRTYSRAFTPKEVRDLYNWAPEPVVYWSLDENTGTTANDISGNGNIGTLNNMDELDWVPGKFGSALDFDGSDDFVDVGTATALDDINPITISAWIYPRTIPGADPRIYAKANATGTQGGVMVLIEGSDPTRLEFRHGFSTAKGMWRSPTNSISTGQWHHFAVTYDNTSTANNPIMYIDGILVTVSEIETPSGTTDSDASYNGIIGNRPDAARAWDGFIDELKIYDYIRTQKQIVEDMNAGHPTGGSPVGSQAGYWKFDEGYGTTANDSIGISSIDGAITGATWTDQANCKINKCLDFDGNDYVQVTGLLGSPAAITVTAWVDLDTADTLGSEIISLGDHVALRLDDTQDTPDNGVNGFYYTGSAWNVTDTELNFAGTGWHHYAYVLDPGNSTQSIYIDGFLRGSSTFSDAISYAGLGSNTQIGRHGNGASLQDVDGRIDEVRVYSSALTQDEILIDMNTGSSINFSAGQDEAADLTDGIGNPPIGYWDFNENTGTTTVFDKGTGQNDGTMDTMTQEDWVPGKYGSALEFDGSSDNIDFGTGPAITGTGAFTASAWIKTSRSDSTEQYIVSQRGPSGFDGEYWLSVETTGYIQFLVYGNGVTQFNISSARTDMLDGQWHHIVGVRNTDGSGELYIDGKLDGSSGGTARTLITLNVFVGVDSLGVNKYFEGIIDEVKIYDYARTPAQVAYEFNRGAPVAHWKFDECTGTILYDSALKADPNAARNDGTIDIGATGSNTTTGTCTSPTDGTGAWYDGKTGKFNSSLNFDGTDDGVTVPTTLTNAEDFTMSVWIYPTADGQSSRSHIMGRSRSTSCCSPVYGIRRDSSNNIDFDTVTSDFSTLESSTPAPTNQWTHIAVTKSGINKTIYINGVSIATDTHSGTLEVSTATEFFGELNSSQGPGNRRFEGKIDDAQFYNYALSEAQIRNVMNQNAAVRFGPTTGSP